MLLFATARSQYAIDAGRGLFLQLPGGTDCGLRQGVWHAVVWDRQPRVGEPFFCSVAPCDGGAPMALRTGPVTWVGHELPPVPFSAAPGAPLERGDLQRTREGSVAVAGRGDGTAGA